MQSIEQIKSAVLKEVEAEGRKFAQEPKAGKPSNDILDALDENEDGDARLYVEQNKDRFLYDVAAGRWYIWTGHSWAKANLGEPLRAIDGVIELYGQEAQRQAWQWLQSEKAGRTDEAEQHKKIEASLLKRIRALQTVSRKENVLTLARTGADSLAIKW